MTTWVRNLRLPAEYSHVTVAATSHLARDTARCATGSTPTRSGEVNSVPAVPGSTDTALWAAGVWFSIKKHWALEAQRLLRARRALVRQN